jgi:NADH-quinone oxidoreductase subunit C
MDLQQYIHDLKELLNQKFGALDILTEIHYDIPVLIIPNKEVHEVMKFLKEDSQFGLSFLTTLCGIHFPDSEEKEFALMYQLQNMSNNTRLRIRTYFDKSNLETHTITDLWAAANWMEREAFDFYGFTFIGHPDLTRILNMDEMNYHPLRKEYELEDASRLDKDDKYFGR